MKVFSCFDLSFVSFFQEFCFNETQHHSSERFQAMITGFIEVGNLLEERKAMIEAVYKKIDVLGW